jgi:hypothetical protein
MGTYEGSVGDGCVTLRRIIRDEFMATIDGEVPVPPVSTHHIGGSIPDLDWEGLQNAADLYASLGVEQFIFASPWYRPPAGSKTPFDLEKLRHMFPNTESVKEYERLAWWEQCGLFEPSPERFPEGIQEFADILDERGMVLGLWYDPRLNTLTEASEIWDDALAAYQCEEGEDEDAWTMGLIDMSREAGRECMFELLERFVVEFGAHHVWHDLNTSPRPRYWEAAEEDGRRGLMELRHYNGSDEVYDRFMETYPDVWIKWCGSGGTMLNLGVFRRCHNFRLADYGNVVDAEARDADGFRDMRTALNWILPTPYLLKHIGLKDAPREGMSREHAFLNLFGSTFAVHHTCRHWSKRDLADMAKAIGVYKNLRHYMRDADYWSLFPRPEGREGWDGWQFHDPKTDTGLLLFFKRSECDEDDNATELRWPEDLSDVRFANVLGEATVEATGGQGIDIHMPDRAALLRYDPPPVKSD